MNGPYTAPELPATSDARATQQFLIDESRAHRLDPIVSCDVAFDHVELTVDPAARNVWETWGHLFEVGALRFDENNNHVTGVGHWGPTLVSVRGLNVNRWWSR